MEKSYRYEIRVEGCLADHWSDWFEGLVIHNDPNGETSISGPLDDQAELFSVLNKIQALNLTIISMHRCSPAE
jgi:hypothetical protein